MIIYIWGDVMKIFLLEDDDAIGIGLTYSLENEGYTVTLAKTVADAFKIIDKDTFSLYILDLTLPDGSGYDVCRKIKEGGDLPVIFLTAFDDEDFNRLCQANGIDSKDYYSNRKALLMNNISHTSAGSAVFNDSVVGTSLEDFSYKGLTVGALINYDKDLYMCNLNPKNTISLYVPVFNIINTILTGIAMRKKEFAMLKSVGTTPKGFNKMIMLESAFYGMKALLFGLPISALLSFAMNRAMSTDAIPFEINWLLYLIVTLVVFVIIGLSMLYSVAKLRNDSIIETLKEEIN